MSQISAEASNIDNPGFQKHFLSNPKTVLTLCCLEAVKPTSGDPTALGPPSLLLLVNRGIHKGEKSKLVTQALGHWALGSVFTVRLRNYVPRSPWKKGQFSVAVSGVSGSTGGSSYLCVLVS